LGLTLPEWWKDLPERDCEYVTYFPVDIRPMEPGELEAGHPTTRRGFGFYIHVPLCDKICSFCNYNKFVVGQSTTVVLDGILAEVAMVIASMGERVTRADFIYFGGGTPSVLTPQHVESVLAAIAVGFDCSDAEVTLECHPTHASRDHLAGYLRVGVNRISFGLQSLDDAMLGRLGSYHTAQTGRDAVEHARDVGFGNIAIDMMFLLPGQRVSDWEVDFRRAVELDADHISTYRLALDPVGPLGRQMRSSRVPGQADESTELEMAQLALDVVSQAGFRHYGSCSSAGFDLAKPGHESTYELLHRAAPQCEYAAIGPGAVGFLNGYVYWNVHTVDEYAAAVRAGHLPALAGRRLSVSDSQSRYAVLGVKHLRLPLEPFRAEFGVSFEACFGRSLQRMDEFGLGAVEGDHLQVSRKGVHYMDNISKLFYNEENFRLPQPYKPALQMMSVDIFGHAG
jgi:oxygen-independent coproporphyrinogen III oxidase